MRKFAMPLLAAAASLAIAAGVASGPASSPRLARSAAVSAAPLRLTLPAPTGPDRIGEVSLHLIDYSRTDPWVPGHQIRQLMISIWYPALDTRRYPRAPWLEPAAAAHQPRVRRGHH